MRVIEIKSVSTNFVYKWPTSQETYDFVIEYEAISDEHIHSIRVGFCKRPTYGRERIRAVVWIDGYPHAEFFSADDYDTTGELLSEIKLSDETGGRMCRYPEDAVPERYTLFHIAGLPNRVNAKGVHNAWVVVSNIADHKTMITLSALRKMEKS